MELEAILAILDTASANLTKLESVAERARPYLPQGPAAGSPPEYDNLVRDWGNLLAGLPPIDGFTITVGLPDIDDIGQSFLGYAEIGVMPSSLYEMMDAPYKQLEEYRYRLTHARANAVATRLEALEAEVDGALRRIEGNAAATTPSAETVVEESIAEIDRLLGDTVERNGRWADLRRHLRFGEAVDWQDIIQADWPSVRKDLRAALQSGSRPLPIPDVDIGRLAATSPGDRVSTALDWAALSPVAFERLLFDLLSRLPQHENVQWLTNTNAPDRGRDLSVERRVTDGTEAVRVERVLIQAKHWQSRSVALSDVQTVLGEASLWDPRFHVVVIATSGRFTTDAISFIERHNSNGLPPRIEMWPENRLESYLARFPDLTMVHGLRPSAR